MTEVILLYDSDCRNVAACRTNLIEAFAASGLQPLWREIDRLADDTPPSLRGYGSPTILVNGSDVAGQESGVDVTSCRIYRRDKGGYVGVPSVEQIAASLSDRFHGVGLFDGRSTGARSWKHSLAVLPALGVALLPSITCPACWPSYAAVLSSIGIGFLPSNRYLLPLTATFLVVYLLMLAWDARRRRRFGLLTVGTMGSIVLLVGRFALASNATLYAGAAILITASIWNAWPAMQTKWLSPQQAKKGCPACQSAVPFDVAEHSEKGIDSGLNYGP